MWAIECTNRHLMGHQGAEPLAGKPGVKVQRRRLDLERWRAQMRKIEVDGMIGRRADRAWMARKQGQGRAMNMPACDELDSRMAPDDGCQFIGVLQILAIHVPDSCDERRMVQEQKRRSIRR